jgi:hypothetical protein
LQQGLALVLVAQSPARVVTAIPPQRHPAVAERAPVLKEPALLIEDNREFFRPLRFGVASD